VGMDRAEAEDQADAARRRGPVRLLSAALFVLLALGAIGISVSSRRVVDDQEERLLSQRAAEVTSLFTLSGAGLQEALRTAATIVQLMPGDPGGFSTTAKAAVATRTFGAMAVLQPDGAGYRIVRAEGAGLGEGRVLAEPVLGTLRRVRPDGVFVSTPVFELDGQRRLGYAVPVAGTNPALLVYAESVLAPPAPTARRQNTLFSDLDGAVYIGDRVDTSQLVVTSAEFEPGSGSVRRTFQLGADTWLLELRAREALVGSLAGRQPWLYLIAGLMAAVFVAALVEVLLRRRQFALGLVDERTAELRQSLVELDAAQKRIVHNERLAAIGELASAVGHELRNPLGVLSNVFYLLRQRLGRDDAFVDRQLGTGEREVAAATLIVSDLLEYSKPRQAVFEAVDVAALVDEVLSVAPPPTGVELGRRFPPGLPPIRADRPQFRQVLLNLVSNAYDAMPEGGLLVIEADQDGESVRFTISDTGGGIAAEALPRLFEPFFTTKAKGIGLGLAVSNRIVEAHGGSLEARTNDDTGASFTVTLPVAPVPASTLQ
jgi:signal transduction histidine kinase